MAYWVARESGASSPCRDDSAHSGSSARAEAPRRDLPFTRSRRGPPAPGLAGAVADSPIPRLDLGHDRGEVGALAELYAAWYSWMTTTPARRALSTILSSWRVVGSSV